MQVDEARRVLGLGPHVELNLTVVRATYRRLVRNAHPDVSAHPDAADRTALLTVAYRVLTDSIDAGTATSAPAGSPNARTTTSHGGERPGRTGSAPSGAGSGGARSQQPTAPPTQRARNADPQPPPIALALVADDTIAVSAPAEEAFMVVLDAAHDLGEIGYLDRTAGLIEVIVEFVEAPTSSVLFSFQGRANGTTEVFCTVEPLSGGDAPPTDAVTRLVLQTLRDAQH